MSAKEKVVPHSSVVRSASEELHPIPMDPGGAGGAAGGARQKKLKRKIRLPKLMSPGSWSNSSNNSRSSQETVRIDGRVSGPSSISSTSGDTSPGGAMLLHSRTSSHSASATDVSSSPAVLDTSFTHVVTSHSAALTSQSAVTSRGGPRTAEDSREAFLTRIQQSEEAIRNGDYERAVLLYTEALELDPSNHILLSNRAAAHLKLGKYRNALNDACRARQLNPSWIKAYFREGLALQCLGDPVSAFVSLSAGVAVEPDNTHILRVLVEAAMKSPLSDRFRQIRGQLQHLDLDKSPFVILSILGQELLSHGAYKAATELLQNALKIGSCSLKLRGSVFSALSRAHWELGNMERSVHYMHQDLNVAKSLGDQEGECRAYGNLGAAYMSRRESQLALMYLRLQLVLSMRHKMSQAASSALTNLGHVYTSIGDYTNALASHKQCVLLVKSQKNRLAEAREIGNVGAVYLAMGDFENAVECHREHLKMAKALKDRKEEARALGNLGSAFHFKRKFDQATAFHEEVLSIAVELKDKALESRAYAGLGHAARCLREYNKAKIFHEKQLENALKCKDKFIEGRACANLGIIYQQLGQYEASLKLHEANMRLSKGLMDKAGLGRAYGNLGNAYSAVGDLKTAVQFHRMELAISKDVNDRHSEAGTHGNLAVCYQGLRLYEKAHHHYHAHLTIARELKDVSSEARALSNVGNYYSTRGEYDVCIPYYEQFLVLSQELCDIVGEGCACHKLGFAHYSLGLIRESIRYYEHDLALAKEVQDKGALSRAYCNLGLALKSNGDFDLAMECQRYFLALTHSMSDLSGQFRALGNIGDIFVSKNNLPEAVKFYDQQLRVAKLTVSKSNEAKSYGALGLVYKLLCEYDKALGFHNRELMIYQELDDAQGECRAHSSLGHVHVALCNFTNAFKCYMEQLERSKHLRDPGIEAQAYGNLAISKMNLALFEESIGYFEKQLSILEQCVGKETLKDKGKALANLGDCYGAIHDFQEAIRCYEQFLAISLNCADLVGQERAYRGLGTAHRALGSLQQALLCCEKRVVLTHEMSDEDEAAAYGELGCLHSMLGNYEQALSCLRQQLRLATSSGDSEREADAACGLGGVLQHMGDYSQAIKYHQMDLDIAEKSGDKQRQCRAYGNLGLSHESLGEFSQAAACQEKHLQGARDMDDQAAETLALTSLGIAPPVYVVVDHLEALSLIGLGRIHHSSGDYVSSTRCLQQALLIAEQLERMEDEAKIRQLLGRSLLAAGEPSQAEVHLYKAVYLFECIRRDAQLNNDYKLSMFDLQTTCYQALQRLLVSMGRPEEAMVVAERSRTRAFVDLLLEKQHGGSHVTSAQTFEDLLCMVSRQSAAVLYYSIAEGRLYSWLITPEQGFVKFHETDLSQLSLAGSEPEDARSLASCRTVSSTGALDDLAMSAWESFGPENQGFRRSFRDNLSINGCQRSETESDVDDLWDQQLTEIGDQLNSDKSVFLRMMKRDHPFNCSTHSSMSLYSQATAMQALTSRTVYDSGGKTTKFHDVSCRLFEALVQPMENHLEQYRNRGNRSLVLVLQGDLFLIPFSVLKSGPGQNHMFEKFDMVMAPSLRSISKETENCPKTGSLVVGNPKLSKTIVDQWQWRNCPGAEVEAGAVADILQSKAMVGPGALKDSVVREMPHCEIIHFATHISWKLSAVILAPPPDEHHDSAQHWIPYDLNESSTSLDDLCLSNFLLTAADILDLQLSAKLVVLSSGHTEDRTGRINSDGIVGLTRAFLAAGAECVLYCLWTVPAEASAILLKTFYTSLLQGLPASSALTKGMAAVQNTPNFGHSANWAGWILVGTDVRLDIGTRSMGEAFRELVETYPESKEAMRVLLHLVEKSLQRISRGQTKSMYTTQTSIASKMGSLTTWPGLLRAVGFRFEEEQGEVPAAVFFPQDDPAEQLAKCSTSLQAMLGSNSSMISAVSKFLMNAEVGKAVTRLIRTVTHNSYQESSLATRLWSAPGCHEFLVALGFDILRVSDDEVTLKLGRRTNGQLVQCGLTTLLALFDPSDLPRTMTTDRHNSSFSSVRSSLSGSLSNFGGSPPPGYPPGRPQGLPPAIRGALRTPGQGGSAFYRPKPSRDSDSDNPLMV